jgi:hypothetical protein
MEIKDNTFARQFESSLNGKDITIEYSVQERKIFLTKIRHQDDLDQESVNIFIEAVLNHIREQKLKVVPVAPKIASFIRKNTSFKEMLPPGIVL